MGKVLRRVGTNGLTGPSEPRLKSHKNALVPVTLATLATF